MNKRKILIFGCGAGGLRAYQALSPQEDILAFLDNDEKKGSSRFSVETLWPGVKRLVYE